LRLSGDFAVQTVTTTFCGADWFAALSRGASCARVISIDPF